VVHALALALAIVLFATPMWPRIANSYPHTVSGSYSIYSQQYQMARFVRRFYNGRGVIANDICAISYMAEGISLLDIAGLGDVEMLRLRRSRALSLADLRRLTEQHHAPMALVYESWLTGIFGSVPPEWVRLGTWKVPHDTVGGDTVTFYATSRAAAPELQSALQQFAPELPKDVIQEGLYRGASSLDPIGVYTPPGGPADAPHYWTVQDAEFGIYPTDQPLAEPAEADFNVGLFALNPNVSIDVFFNGEKVGTKTLTPEENQRWLSFPVKVKWAPGRNVLKLVGHGTPGVLPGGDQRPVLFAVLDPRLLLDDGKVVAQPGVKQNGD
jgi:hypothetical protein